MKEQNLNELAELIDKLHNEAQLYESDSPSYQTLHSINWELKKIHRDESGADLWDCPNS